MTNPNNDPSLTDTRTPYQKAVDMAWRTENMDHLLRERGEEAKAAMAHFVMVSIFTLSPDDVEWANYYTDYLNGLVTDCDGYDSGFRKFEQPPAPEA